MDMADLGNQPPEEDVHVGEDRGMRKLAAIGSAANAKRFV